jgi:two-component system chemotaxis sensor kinase CheA
METKIEDALRVKVSLLNNLMNLAGELVLSRNQLMQSMNRKLSDAIGMETLMRGAEKAAQSQTRISSQDSAQVDQAKLLRDVAQNLSLRLVDVPGMGSILQNIDMVTSLLQESIMQTRLQPISVVFSKFPRLIRDLAKKLGKDINLTLVGQDVELDKSIVEQLSDPLTHLIRNSVDHGVEGPQERIAAGKPVTGEVVLRAFHEGGKVHIQIQDDGAGINRERVKQKALEKGLFTEEDFNKMSDREIDGIIMLPGFSTAKVISDVSGRGVGMDVVKTNIERLGGTVDIESVPGKGTTITMKLPLTLAIISSLIVSAGGRRFAIPQVGINELVRIRAKDVTSRIDRLKNCEVMRLRGKLLPLVRLEQALSMAATYVNPETEERAEDKRQRWSDRRGMRRENDTAMERQGDAPTGRLGDGAMERRGDAAAQAKKDSERRQGPDRRTSVANALKIIVLKYGDNHYGLVVEEVYDSEEIVVKPLSGYLKSSQCYAGSTIMGDGSVAMILDTNGIATLANLKFGDLEKDVQLEKEKFLAESGKTFRELLLFDAGENGNFGVDLSTVARVEKVESGRIAGVGGKEFLKYDDHSMRLIRLSDYLPVSPSSQTSGQAFVIVPKGVKHLMGIVADEVKDVVKTDATLDTKNIRGPGIIGSVMINSALTLVIDVDAIFKSAEPDLS